MNISLTKELEEYVASQLKTGLYGSASEVIREALRTHIMKQKRAHLEGRLARSENQMDQGEYLEASDAYWESKKQMIRDKYMNN
jgi:antitoxin ParD1/3/4